MKVVLALQEVRMAPGPALGFGGPCSAPFLAMPFPGCWEPRERGQGPGSPLIEHSEYLGVLESPLDCKEIQLVHPNQP